MKVFRISGRDRSNGPAPLGRCAASMKVFRISGRDDSGKHFIRTILQASMKVFRISGRELCSGEDKSSQCRGLNESLPHKRKRHTHHGKAGNPHLCLNESLPHKRKRRPPNFSSFELLKLRASRA